MGQTVLSGLVNPQVMADMITAKLPKAIKFSPLATIDTTLVGQAGNTITVPQYAYVGDAEDVAEGVAMGTTVLTASSTTATVKKAGKALEITDESVLSGYGDPVGEATSQITKSIAAKVDNDCLTALSGATLLYDGIATVITYDGIVNAVDKFGEEDYTEKVMFINPVQITTLRKDADFKSIDQYPFQTVMTGVIGKIAGCQIIPSKKVVLNTAATGWENYIVKVTNTVEEADADALTIYMKRDVNIESDRDILTKTTVVAADEHYVAVLSNASKVVKATFLK